MQVRSLHIDAEPSWASSSEGDNTKHVAVRLTSKERVPKRRGSVSKYATTDLGAWHRRVGVRATYLVTGCSTSLWYGTLEWVMVAQVHNYPQLHAGQGDTRVSAHNGWLPRLGLRSPGIFGRATFASFWSRQLYHLNHLVAMSPLLDSLWKRQTVLGALSPIRLPAFPSTFWPMQL